METQRQTCDSIACAHRPTRCRSFSYWLDLTLDDFSKGRTKQAAPVGKATLTGKFFLADTNPCILPQNGADVSKVHDIDFFPVFIRKTDAVVTARQITTLGYEIVGIGQPPSTKQ